MQPNFDIGNHIGIEEIAPTTWDLQYNWENVGIPGYCLLTTVRKFLTLPFQNRVLEKY